MALLSKHRYSSLQQADSVMEDDMGEHILHLPPKTRLRAILLKTALFLLIAVTGFILGLLVKTNGYATTEMTWSSELSAIKETPTRFNGSFEFTNRYRGKPSPQIDREWDRFTDHPLIDGTASLIAVSEEDIKRANKTSDGDWFNTTVKYGAINGGGYMATLELFHQLHCLNMLRKAVHSDYYEEMRPLGNGSHSHRLITHLDHCIEILRQVISCHADTGLITFHWVRDNPVPYPDFNTWHQCKNPEEVLAWAKAREAPIGAMVKKKQFPGLVEMPHAPQGGK